MIRQRIEITPVETVSLIWLGATTLGGAIIGYMVGQKKGAAIGGGLGLAIGGIRLITIKRS